VGASVNAVAMNRTSSLSEGASPSDALGPGGAARREKSPYGRASFPGRTQASLALVAAAMLVQAKFQVSSASRGAAKAAARRRAILSAFSRQRAASVVIDRGEPAPFGGGKVAVSMNVVGRPLSSEAKPHLDGGPIRPLIEAFGLGTVAGLLVAGGLYLAFRSEFSLYLPIIAIAAVGSALVLSAIVYDLRR